MGLKMPSISILFKTKGITAIERSQRGIIAMIFDDSSIDNEIIYSVDDIPETAKDYTKEQIQLALTGYQTSPRYIKCFNNAMQSKTSKDADGKDVVTTIQDYTEILKKLENERFDYLVIPAIDEKNVTIVSSWIKSQRTVYDKMVKAVLPNCPADFEGIVNFTNTTIKTKTKTYTTAEYCARIAGMICGTPATISCTYAPLAEVIDCDRYTKDEMDAKVGKGELFVFYDGEKFKIARGVNSFVTTMQNKGDEFKKIKLVDLMDMIHDDIKDTAKESYIGKYANSYDNRQLLINAILGYFQGLERDSLLEISQNTVDIDLDSTKIWLLSNGLKTKDELSKMSTIEIKQANVHDNVFLTANISPLDAIENITLNINLD